MMAPSIMLFLLCILAVTHAASAQTAPSPPVTWPSPFYDRMEMLMMQYSGYRRSGFLDFVTPCGFSSTGQSGRIAAAEWIRTAYHDMATADVAAGTGGLDASLIYETDRGENIGNGLISSFGFFANFLSARSSMADLIALGTHTATRSCRGPFIQYRAGRVDAVAAGPLGVPQPNETIATLTQRFAKAGFNGEDMIGLVACGHTLGGVHGEDFPDIVPLPNGTLHTSEPFDSTASAFDNKVVTEYLADNSSSPLLHGPADTNSDAVVFGSDGNVTMKAMADPAAFADRCQTLFERMINTVPSGVNLTNPIVPYEVKPVEIRVTVADSKTLNFAGDIRVRTTVRPASQISSLEVVYLDRDGGSSTCGNCTLQTTKVTILLGSTVSLDESFFWFTVNSSIPSSSGISSYKVNILLTNGTVEVHDNNGEGFPVPNLLFFQPSMSCNTPFINVTTLLNNTIVAAVHTSLVTRPNPILTATARRVRPGVAFIPELFTFDVEMKSFSGNGTTALPKEYVWYSGNYSVDITAFSQLSFDIVSGEGSDEVMDGFRTPGTMQPC